MYPIDSLIISSAVLSFSLFVIIQFLILRFLDPDNIFKGIVRIFVCVAVVNVMITLYLLCNIWPALINANFVNGLVGLILALSLYGLLSFLYVLFVVGPYETSIRIRIIREFFSVAPRRISYTQLLERYDNKVIIQKRLNRLLKAEKISCDGKYYRIQRRLLFFSVTEGFSKFLNRWLQNRQETQVAKRI